MTFDDIWERLTSKRPKLDDDQAVVQITAYNLRRLLQQVYELGQKSAPNYRSPADDPLNILRDLFG